MYRFKGLTQEFVDQANASFREMGYEGNVKVQPTCSVAYCFFQARRKSDGVSLTDPALLNKMVGVIPFDIVAQDDV